MTTQIYRARPMFNSAKKGAEPAIYSPLLDFTPGQLIGLRVFVWSREAEDEYKGTITEYNSGGFPMYVVRIDEEFVTKYDAPKGIQFNEGAYTDSGSYRIVGAEGTAPALGFVVVEKSYRALPLTTPEDKEGADRWLRTFRKEHPEREYVVREALASDVMSDEEIAEAAGDDFPSDAEIAAAAADIRDGRAAIEVPASVMLPGELFMALVTRRPELAKLLRANVNKGKELTPEEVDGILTLAEQTIEAEAAMADTIANHRKAIKDMLSNAAGVVTALNRMVETLDTHPSNVGGQGGRN